MPICHQCGEQIDTTQAYALGGEPGLMDGPKPATHLGACETMPVFVMLVPPARIVKTRRASVYTLETLKKRGYFRRELLGSLCDRSIKAL